MVKNPPPMRETWVRSLDWEDPRRRAWHPTPVLLPGESPWTGEPDRLQTTRLQTVRQDWAAKHTYMCTDTQYLFFSFWLASLCVTGSRLKQPKIKLIGIDWAGWRKSREAGGVPPPGWEQCLTEHRLSAWQWTFTGLFTCHISSEFSNSSRGAYYPDAVVSTLYKGKQNLTAFK